MSYTPAAKRRLNFRDSPRSKRYKPSPYASVPLYRIPKPEMKYLTFPISHGAVTAATTNLYAIANGAENGQRVGNKIKVHTIEYMISVGTPYAVRMDLVIPKDPSVGAGVSYLGSTSRELHTVVLTKFFNNGSAATNGWFGYHKLPYGIVIKYSGALGTSIIENALQAVTSVPSAAPVSGYFRLWYTDV